MKYLAIALFMMGSIAWACDGDKKADHSDTKSSQVASTQADSSKPMSSQPE